MITSWTFSLGAGKLSSEARLCHRHSGQGALSLLTSVRARQAGTLRRSGPLSEQLLPLIFQHTLVTQPRFFMPALSQSLVRDTRLRCTERAARETTRLSEPFVQTQGQRACGCDSKVVVCQRTEKRTNANLQGNTWGEPHGNYPHPSSESYPDIVYLSSSKLFNPSWRSPVSCPLLGLSLTLGHVLSMPEGRASRFQVSYCDPPALRTLPSPCLQDGTGVCSADWNCRSG